jgi:hypothetical protein
MTFLAPDVVTQRFCSDPTAWTIDKARRPENRSHVFLEERQHREGAEQCYHQSREGLTNGDQATVGSTLSKASGQGGHPPAPCGHRPSPSSALAQSSTAKNRHCSHAHQPNNFHQWRSGGVGGGRGVGGGQRRAADQDDPARPRSRYPRHHRA